MSNRGSLTGPDGSAGFLAAIVDSADDAIEAMTLDGTVLYWNAAAERMYGYAADEIVGQSISLIVPPERESERAGILTTVAKGERVVRLETKRRTRDGRTLDVSLTVSPIRNADGTITAASVIARDISDRARFASESQRAERLEVASRLARGIAKELVDLVTAIQGHASLVLEDLAEDPRSGRSAEAVRRATERAAEVAHQLLALSGDQVLRPRPIDLNQAVAGSIRLLGEIAGRSTTIDLELDPHLPDVEVDPDQLDHVLVGLVASSRDRMRPGGTITFATRSGTSATGEPDVVLTVRDNGAEIPQEELDQLFEPFHARRSADGNLWLATAHGILDQSGGSIRASSGPEGTTFTVRLPASAEMPIRERPRVVDPLPAGTEWIMVVEDEDGVRDFISRALGRLGYHVTAVSSGEDALEQTRGYFAEPIDLLITDVVLPGMSGPELANTITSSRPSMPVLFVSGYASDVTAFHGLPGLAANVLAKPFGMDTLVRRVRAILDERSNRGGAPAPEAGHKWEQEAEAEPAVASIESTPGAQPEA